MKKLAPFALAALFALAPLSAFAHATPISYDPDSSSTVTKVPKVISITFSEHLSEGASSVKVTGPSGAVVSEGEPNIDKADTRKLSIPVRDDGKGAYLVSWSVVSGDDGHFTKGAYYFGVGAPPPVDQNPGDEFTVVENSNIPEAFGITVELFGHGLVWALLFLFIFSVRPLFKTGEYEREKQTVASWYIGLFLFAVCLVEVGGAFQLFIKAQSLMSIRGGGLWDALAVYAGTDAGSATVVRMFVALSALVVVFFGRKKIFDSLKVTVYEWATIGLMCVFAFFRAKISHATANPFYPDLSIGVNFFHLIDKDIWAGILLILLLLSFSKRMRGFFAALIPRAFAMLAVVFLTVSATATYIVWLHLKSFGNLFTTEWGESFLMLLSAAVLLVGIRTYHVFARRFRPRFFFRGISGTLAVEFALALLVVFYSSVVIITSPPLDAPVGRVFSASDQGITVTLSRDASEDGMAFLSASGGAVHTPVVTVKDESSGDEPVSVDVETRYMGGYAVPLALMSGAGPYDVSITVPQEKGYDAHASFAVHKGDLDAVPEGARSLDFFTFAMIGIGLAAVLYALFLRHHAHARMAEERDAKPFMPEVSAAVLLLLTLMLVSSFMNGVDAAGLFNPYKAKCVGDGNEWHLMVPMRAGAVLSETPREGCMWGMGSSMYMFPTEKQYDFLHSLPEADVTLTTIPAHPVAGEKVKLTVSLKEPDGSPALLYVDMDKLLHMVVVSRDESVFAHIHADDNRPLTAEEIANSTYTLDYIFPKSGQYMIAVDYAHGLNLESKQFTVDVGGGPSQSADIKTYSAQGTFDGYDISMKADFPVAGQVTTLWFTVTKNGKPVTNMTSYLSAAAHVANVKNDFTAFIHAHGEVHPPGTPFPPIIIKNGQVIHSMAAMIVPPTFGPQVEAHLIYPSAGIYTVWAQFNIGGVVIPASFTLKVEE